ncbi:hypothetical protein KY290_029607 [Solanum tuberosum]|uniref:Uncharacterized protein n=1 Tax=Solanum tuberosum TaxID=4113 RepID=A0ABQ7UL79_SOLTU|nr:hypothetical protein KY289_028801 [Solanum tuberosum]KAH0663675.1 hypothetical protein KY284_028606 [Solanum tuberosum]KAH0667454.1 hypothetical protein KY285_028660 [Solanum tuberosum]KAH0750375.1 hypothetical protein KY290_029607 [Solanum tuberosum]
MEVKRNEEINQVMEAKETNDSGKNLQVMQSSNGINNHDIESNGRKTTQDTRTTTSKETTMGKKVIRIIR